MPSLRLKSVLAATSLLTPLWALPASAQIEEIIITAQKRAEKLQEAPIAVTALNKDALDARSITGGADLSAFAPNLTVGTTSAGAGDWTISMRGLPAADTLLSNDNPVAMYIDGVIQARLAGATLDLVDLERVEVLRGPQGTLYGRNATGGAVNFITKRPTDEFNITQKLGYGTNNHFVSRTQVNTGKIGNTGLKANLAFLYNKRDGLYDNTLTPDDVDPGADDTRAFRAELMYDQGGDFTASYSILYLAQESGAAAPAQVVAIGSNLAAALIPGTLDVSGSRRDTVSLDRQTTGDTELYLHNFTMEWAVTDDLTIKTITGYRHYDNFVGGPDLDGDAGVMANIAFGGGVQTINLFSATNKRQHEQFTQEIQFVGEWTKQFKYVVGGYFFTENASERNPQSFFVPGPIPAFFIPLGQGIVSGNSFAFNTETDSWAVFGQGTYTPPILNDKLSLTFGLRYTEDTKFTELLNSTTQFLPLRGSRRASFNNLSYAATVDYKWTDTVLTYFKHSTGYKAGGFNTRSANLEPYQEETIEAYEAGIKAEWFNRNLQTNLAIFYNKARNQQVASFVADISGATNVVRNAGRSHYQGIEFEVIAIPVEGLTLNATFGYIDPQYDMYAGNDKGTLEPINFARIAKFGYTSEVTWNAGIQYDSQPISWIGGGRFLGRIDVLGQSEQTWHPGLRDSTGPDNPFLDLATGDARTVVNGRLALREIPIAGTGATVEVALWGKNILDEKYVVQGIDFGQALNFAEYNFGQPRTGGFEMIFLY